MKRDLLILELVLMLVVTAACLPKSIWPTFPAQALPTHTPTPLATPADQKSGAGGAYVDSIEILILESFPVQIRAIIKGNLPDGCTRIEQIDAVRQDNTFQIVIRTQRPAGQVCTDALVPFEEPVSLDVFGLKAGTYTVAAGAASQTFALTADNMLPATPANRAIENKAAVESVRVDVVKGTPLKVAAVARGNLPDGCTKISRSEQKVQGNDILITLFTERPADAMCTMALVPFEEELPVDVTGLAAGTYRVIVNDVSVTLKLD